MMTQSVETSCQKSSFVINKASSSVLLCLNHVPSTALCIAMNARINVDLATTFSLSRKTFSRLGSFLEVEGESVTEREKKPDPTGPHVLFAGRRY